MTGSLRHNWTRQDRTIVDSDNSQTGRNGTLTVVRTPELMRLKQKKNILGRASQWVPVIIPEQRSQAVTSAGPVSITAFRVRLVRSHTLGDFCWSIFTEGDTQAKLLAGLANHSTKTFEKDLERRDG